MSKKLFVGNLPYSMNDESLQKLFSRFGTVESARIITDRDTGRSKGFGFVEMTNNQEAEAAISQLNGSDIEGRAMAVSEARPQAPRGGGGGRDRGDRGGWRGGAGGERRW
jgi:RNA recognition motif-containing protein